MTNLAINQPIRYHCSYKKKSNKKSYLSKKKSTIKKSTRKKNIYRPRTDSEPRDNIIRQQNYNNGYESPMDEVVSSELLTSELLSNSLSYHKPMCVNSKRIIIYNGEMDPWVSIWDSLSVKSKNIIGQLYHGDIINVETEIEDKNTCKLLYLEIKYGDKIGFISTYKNNIETTKIFDDEKNNEPVNNVSEKSLDECVICYRNLATKIALPCGHYKFCKECVDKLSVKKCPVCVQSFDKYIKLYG